ncbi:hypothetical protein CO015_02955 [candidate division WWE3 bacterium CG_4_8_14_3_um_filter_42_11]|uniref:Uncharacterized protein n=3 Tax=Katanobacteria TaxID=422282 RepID=A0A2M8G6T4_UNCKA|nr:MAG: hypothetical protein CO015_02955 [candidate division WWE3 bacterium CG_4_8_14_3_um_filter_42_11]
MRCLKSEKRNEMASKSKKPSKRPILIFLLILGLLLPHFLSSNQKITQAKEQATLAILTPRSHPGAGEDWAVSFETQGTADLTITPMDGATIDDLEFVGMKCSEEEVIPEIREGDVLFFPNWTCDDIGTVTHLVNVAGKHTLKFQFGDKTAYAYNNPDVETLRPNVAGDEENLSYGISGAGNHWQDVDEAIADDETTKVRNDTDYNNFQRDLYGIENSSGSGTINSVTIYARVRQGIANGDFLKIVLKTGGTVYESTKSITGSWVNYSHEWTSNSGGGS